GSRRRRSQRVRRDGPAGAVPGRGLEGGGGATVSLFRLVLEKELDHPVLVMVLEGWIDAGFGAAAAAAALLGTIPNDVVATFDSDELIDHRARRPVMHIVDGVNTGLNWPEFQLRAGHDRTGKDVLMLVGPDPD